MRTSQKTPETITTIGIDLGKNTFHLVGLDKRGAIVLQLKVSRGQLERGMEACSGSHHIGRQLAALGHDVRLIPAQYVKPFLKGHKNDYRDAEAIAEAVQRPTMHFVAIKTPEQMDLLALQRVRSRLVGQRTGVIDQTRGFLPRSLRPASFCAMALAMLAFKGSRCPRCGAGCRCWLGLGRAPKLSPNPGCLFACGLSARWRKLRTGHVPDNGTPRRSDRRCWAMHLRRLRRSGTVSWSFLLPRAPLPAPAPFASSLG